MPKTVARCVAKIARLRTLKRSRGHEEVTIDSAAQPSHALRRRAPSPPGL